MSRSDQADILLVDDTPDNLRVLSSMLVERGYKARKVTGSRRALSVVKQAPPDLILLDVMMPELDGYEVCQQLKADEATALIPIIFISALDELIDKVRAFSVGGVDFITKPFQVEEVIARIETHLSIRRLQDQLREKNRALEATLQMREDLSRMVIHDLKNPVSTILLYSNALLDREDLRDRVYQRVDVINQAAQRLQGLITDLLMLAKMESGKLLLNPQEVDLYELILSVTQELYPLAEERNCDLRLRWPESHERVWIDQNLFRRLLDNLLSNAIKFSPEGGAVLIELSYGSIAEFPKRQAQLRIMDQGPGIPVTLQQTIFDRFDVGLSRDAIPQIGLGLAFCKMVVEAHGGQIRVEDNQPHGAIFIVEV